MASLESLVFGDEIETKMFYEDEPVVAKSVLWQWKAYDP